MRFFRHEAVHGMKTTLVSAEDDPLHSLVPLASEDAFRDRIASGSGGETGWKASQDAF